MGLWAMLCGAIGCARTGRTPALSEYRAVLYRQRALKIDPASAGRYEIVPGERMVLKLHALRGKSLIARDTQSDWSVAVELPPAAEEGKPLAVALETVPSAARVAGEDIVYFAQRAKGQLTLGAIGAVTTGHLKIVFAAPERDLLQLGAFSLAGDISARAE